MSDRVMNVRAIAEDGGLTYTRLYIPDKAGQGTGIPDREGTEIYEGDIVEYPLLDFKVEIVCDARLPGFAEQEIRDRRYYGKPRRMSGISKMGVVIGNRWLYKKG
jgi:hypothetical protein